MSSKATSKVTVFGKELPERTFVLWASAVLVALVFAAYGQVLGHGFTVMDDRDYVSENVVVQKGLSVEGFVWAFEGEHHSNWHPLTWLSHMLDCQLFGLNAGAHKAMNVLLHASNAVLLFFAMRMMTGTMWRSLAVAAIFALHPQRVESVAWVSERKDVLSGLFWMLALIAYARYAKRPGWKNYLWVFGAMAFGLMSKSMLVTLPFVLLLLDVWPLRRGRLPGVTQAGAKNAKGLNFSKRSWLQLVLEKAPLLGLAVAASVVAMYAQSGTAITGFDQVGLGVRVANALNSWVAYVGQMAWPFGLVAFYPHPSVVAGDLWKELYLPAVGSAVLLLAATWGVLWGTFWAKERKEWLAVGWFWYLGTLVPVIGIIQIGLQARADRYTYLPTIGVAIMLAWGVSQLLAWRPGLKRVVQGGALVLAIGWTALTCVQASYWRTDIRLFSRSAKVIKNSYFAHHQLGWDYFQNKNFALAAKEFKEALTIFPRYASAHNNLALVYMETGDHLKAETHFRKAIRYGSRRLMVLRNLTLCYKKQGKFKEALECMEEVRWLAPDDLTALLELGLLHAELGRYDEGIAFYNQVLASDPNNVVAINDLGVIYLRLGDREKAIKTFRKALELDPTDETTKKNLEALLKMNANGQEQK